MQRKQNNKSLAFRFLMAGASLSLLVATRSPAFIFSLQATMPPAAYYVSNSGDDNWDGRSPTYEGGSTGPWKTLQHADDTVFLPGDILYLNCGDVFQGPMILQGSGNPGRPCSVRPYGTGVRPIIKSSAWTGISFHDCAWEIQGLEICDSDIGIFLEWRDKADWEYFRFTDLYIHHIAKNFAIHWITTGNPNPTQTIFRDIEIPGSNITGKHGAPTQALPMPAPPPSIIYVSRVAHFQATTSIRFPSSLSPMA